MPMNEPLPVHPIIVDNARDPVRQNQKGCVNEDEDLRSKFSCTLRPMYSICTSFKAIWVLIQGQAPTQQASMSACCKIADSKSSQICLNNEPSLFVIGIA